MTAALETQGLGRRYGSQWALRDCTLEIVGGVLIFLGIYLERRLRHQAVVAARLDSAS